MKRNSFTKLLCVLAGACGIIVQGNAQDGYHCGADVARQKLVAEHPEILAEEAELEEFIKNYKANYGQNARSGPYIIPIVFHIIHQGGTENISDAQVRDQVRILNEDYNKGNADTSTVISQFQNLIADVGIEFRLANIDPNGNCTNGIERINSSQTYVGNDYSKLSGWPREKYLNVWVVRSMQDGVAGYAYYPGSVNVVYNLPNRDGVIILSNYIGSIGTGTYGRARALTHEIGHYLNLKHTWGDNNNPGISCGDDDVDDTPTTKGYTYCPTPANAAICEPPIVENYQNYMDYSYCSKMFTIGQGERMIAALNSNKSDRDNLYAPGNLVATGIDDTTYSPCAPKADFSSNKRYVCLGDKVTMVDGSYNGEVADYYWEFPTGLPGFSTDKNPIVEFLSPGWQPVKLTVTNAYGQSVKNDTAQVYVGYSQTLYVAPYSEGFEDPQVFTNDWAAINHDKNETEFRYVNFASHSGSGSAQVNNYASKADHDIDEIISPAIDLTGLNFNTLTGDAKLTFYYSVATWAQNLNNLADSICVTATTNCGTSWINVYKEGGSDFVNAGYYPQYFAPDGLQVWWQKVQVSLPSTLKRDNVRFKFQLYSAVKGNNFYIDDINIGQAVVSGIEENTVLNNVSVYPNPAGPQATVSINLSNAANTLINVTDMTGKAVQLVYSGMLTEGENNLIVNTGNLAKGIYLVNVTAGETTSRHKLVVE